MPNNTARYTTKITQTTEVRQIGSAILLYRVITSTPRSVKKSLNSPSYYNYNMLHMVHGPRQCSCEFLPCKLHRKSTEISLQIMSGIGSKVFWGKVSFKTRKYRPIRSLTDLPALILSEKYRALFRDPCSQTPTVSIIRTRSKHERH